MRLRTTTQASFIVGTILIGAALVAASTASSGPTATATKRRDVAAQKTLWYIKVKNPFLAPLLSGRTVKVSRPAIGRLRVTRVTPRVRAEVICIHSLDNSQYRQYGCRFNITLIGRAAYIGLAFAKFYTENGGGGFDVEMLSADCHPLGTSQTCRLHPFRR